MSVDIKRPAETIMVVDDSEVVLDLVVTILREEGYGVLAAPDAAGCLNVLRRYQGPIDLLLTDVMLPGKSGRELFNDLKLRYPRLKVLYMSGYSDAVIGQSGGLGQGAHFIEKPFSIHALRHKIRQAIGS